MTKRAATILVATLLGLSTVLLGAGPAAAAPARVCRIGDKRLTEISGLAATTNGYVVVNDGSDEASHRKIFYLDQNCEVTRTVSYPSRPRDTEDLGIAGDGTLWVADIGDNNENRDTIALWRLAVGARKPTLFRLRYPDGPHNAEALLLTRSGSPIIITKGIGAAGLYLPAAKLDAKKTTALRQAGDVTIPFTDTANPFSFAGRMVITGGAVSPDGSRATLRTYADAFEFDAPDGDLVAALTKGTPRQIPLPDEPQGESVAYTPDGTALLTVSETSEQPAGARAEILHYPLPNHPAPITTSAAPASPTSAPVAAPESAAPPPATSRSPDAAAGSSQLDRIPAGALITGGALLTAAAALGLITALRRRQR